MKFNRLIRIYLVLLVLAGCSDAWDDRFDENLEPSQSVWEIINTRSDFAGFRDLLHETGYDTILQRNTAYTIFVPKGGSLDGVSGFSAVQKRELAASHVSNSVVYSKDIREGSRLRSLSGKNLNFSIAGSLVQINNDVTISQQDIIATNGVLHEISEPLIIRPNILEFMNREQAYSYIADYFNNNTELIFDAENSIPTGINDVGQTIYDTIWRQSNPLFDDVADITSEDQLFTIFLAGNTLLDTADFGELRPGYLSGIGDYIVEGMLEAADLAEPQQSVSGKILDLPGMSFRAIGRASNGMIYALDNFAGILIPKTFTWEITNIADFDTIRGVRQVNYASMVDKLTGIRVYDVNGGFSAFSYAFDPRAVNTDYLRIQTLSGTSASLDVKLPDMAPGEYRLIMNAMIRQNDGITFNVYINGEQIKQGVSLNGGAFVYTDFDLGIFHTTQQKENLLTLKIDGSNALQRAGFIDYLKFEPVNK